MRRVEKSAEFLPLSNWLNETHDDGWRAFQNPLKSETLSKLEDDQGGICCYCNGVLAGSASHIEHFRPQSSYPEERFSWSNLFASCGGDGVPPHTDRKDRHCGHAKESDFPTDGFLSLLSEECETALHFSLDGAVRPSNAAHKGATNALRILNLGSQSLVRRRKSAIDSAYADLETLPFDVWSAIYMQADAEGKFVEFQGVLKNIFGRELDISDQI